MMKIKRKIKLFWQRMTFGNVEPFPNTKPYSDKDVINLILYCSEEKAKALLKEGPDSNEAKSLSNYLDMLYDILVKRKENNYKTN